MTAPTRDTAAYVADLTAIDKSALPADGGERFNRLIFARSPYLLQHAENPVDWYEWGDAAFARAREENLPILLSIGYATCHWCHVMAYESFEDAEVAALLNRHFVCIKVDREERPDIDDFYMAVSQALTGSGGWPLNIFMKPDKQPFMAITYLPKRAMGGMSGMMELLANIATLWRQRPDMIDRNCQSIMDELESAGRKSKTTDSPDIMVLFEKAFTQLENLYDIQYGGFGSSPKFPMPIYLSWLLGLENNAAHTMALHTLRQIRSGGLWDQLGGGLHRYSVDQFWLVPHFEKMLYDQAMLALTTTDAWLATGDPYFRCMTEEIFSFIERDLTSSEGAFYSALDADSEGEEGKFYLWNKGEIDDFIRSDAELFDRFHNITDEGNFAGRTILTAPLTMEEFCQRYELPVEQTIIRLRQCRKKLLELREQRIRPLKDDKIITSWNALMISALATAGIVCNDDTYIASATRAANFVLTNLWRSDGRLLRSYLDGASTVPAFLEDYAFLACGLLDLHKATLDLCWLRDAQKIADEIMRLFFDSDSGEFTSIGCDAEQMPSRVMSNHDGVIPSAFARAAYVFYRLAWINNTPELLETAWKILNGISGEMYRYPAGYLGALQVMSCLSAEPIIATFRGRIDTTDAFALNTALQKHIRKNLIIRSEPSLKPLSLYICPPGVCYPAVATVAQLRQLLKIS